MIRGLLGWTTPEEGPDHPRNSILEGSSVPSKFFITFGLKIAKSTARQVPAHFGLFFGVASGGSHERPPGRHRNRSESNRKTTKSCCQNSSDSKQNYIEFSFTNPDFQRRKYKYLGRHLGGVWEALGRLLEALERFFSLFFTFFSIFSASKMHLDFYFEKTSKKV